MTNRLYELKEVDGTVYPMPALELMDALKIGEIISRGNERFPSKIIFVTEEGVDTPRYILVYGETYTKIEE